MNAVPPRSQKAAAVLDGLAGQDAVVQVLLEAAPEEFLELLFGGCDNPLSETRDDSSRIFIAYETAIFEIIADLCFRAVKVGVVEYGHLERTGHTPILGEFAIHTSAEPRMEAIVVRAEEVREVGDVVVEGDVVLRQQFAPSFDLQGGLVVSPNWERRVRHEREEVKESARWSPFANIISSS
jgi:hypothetical protein